MGATIQLELPAITDATIIKNIDLWAATVNDLEGRTLSRPVRLALFLAVKAEDAWRDLYYGNNAVATDEDPHPRSEFRRAVKASKLARTAIEAIR